MSTISPPTIISVVGPYREPKEPAFSWDYVIQRLTWTTPHGVRVKVAIVEELERLKTTVLQVSGGSPGQQVKVNQILSRRIADKKFELADADGMFSERRDVMVGPFTAGLAHLMPQLEKWMEESKATLRQEIRDQIGI